VDAANPLVYARAADLGIPADAPPGTLDRDETLLARLEALRRAASVASGLAATLEQAAANRSVPKLALVAAAGRDRGANGADLQVRSLSMGRFHPSFQLTGAVCTTVAAAVPGTVVHEALGHDPRSSAGDLSLRIGHPAGILEVAGRVVPGASGAWVAERVSVGRTARRIMDGWVIVPAGALAP
jgi:2-methylaconitate cis-trans-isomerase PrpF